MKTPVQITITTGEVFRTIDLLLFEAKRHGAAGSEVQRKAYADIAHSLHAQYDHQRRLEDRAKRLRGE
jgi:hypothetical protein